GHERTRARRAVADRKHRREQLVPADLGHLVAVHRRHAPRVQHRQRVQRRAVLDAALEDHVHSELGLVLDRQDELAIVDDLGLDAPRFELGEEQLLLGATARYVLDRPPPSTLSTPCVTNLLRSAAAVGCATRHSSAALRLVQIVPLSASRASNERRAAASTTVGPSGSSACVGRWPSTCASRSSRGVLFSSRMLAASQRYAQSSASRGVSANIHITMGCATWIAASTFSTQPALRLPCSAILRTSLRR